MQHMHVYVQLTQRLEMLQGCNTEDCYLGRLGTYLSPLFSQNSVHTALG